MNWQREFKFNKVTTKNFGGHKDEVGKSLVYGLTKVGVSKIREFWIE